MAEQLSDRETAEMIQLGIEYDPRPHLDAGHPDRASATVRRRTREVLVRRGTNPRGVLAVGEVAWRRALQAFRQAVGA